VVLPLQPLGLWTTYKARWVWAGAVAKKLLRPRARCSSPRPAPRRCHNRRKTTRQMCSGEEYIYPALSVQWQVSPRGDEPSKSSSRWPKLCGGRSTTDAFVYRWRLRQKTRCGPPAALPGAGVWRRAWVDGAHRPSTTSDPPRRAQRKNIRRIALQ
jgi:hypothetical protein